MLINFNNYYLKAKLTQSEYDKLEEELINRKLEQLTFPEVTRRSRMQLTFSVKTKELDEFFSSLVRITAENGEKVYVLKTNNLSNYIKTKAI